MIQETILIVDDNKEIISILSQILKAKGYAVLGAFDGSRGLELALSRSPNLILLDWNLPELSGMQVLQALRNRGSNAPVILMTIYGSENIAVQAFRLGIRDYIRKPVQIEETMEAIERALSEDRLRREKEEIAKELAKVNGQLQQQLLELTTLQTIAQSVTEVLDLETVLSRVVEAACYFGNARESVLFLIDEETNDLALRAYHGKENRAADLRLSYNGTPLRQVIETGTPLVLNPRSSGYAIKLKTGYLVRSMLFVPLQIRSRTIGLLGVTDKMGRQPFAEEDVRLLSSLADHAAIAIENARLYESERELARARTVKQMIVTLSHYIMNPLTAINLSTYELTTRLERGEIVAPNHSVKHCLQLIEMNVKEIVAVMTILRQLASLKSVVYIGDIEMIDIEDEVKRRVRKIQEEYVELERAMARAAGAGDGERPVTQPAQDSP